MKITRIALKRPVAMTVLSIAIFAIGLFSYKQLAVDYLPEIIYPMIRIHMWWRGATPEEIETNVAEPVERVLSTVDNLDYLESSSIEGMYTLRVNFQYGVDVEEAYLDVITAMGRVARKLPKDMDPPVIIKADPSQLPVMQVTISSRQRDLVWLREWADNWLTDRLTVVPGTAGVEVVGGLKREIRVHLDPQRMQAYNLSAARIAKSLADENLEMFAGRVKVENREIIARTMGEFESADEIANVVVAHGPSNENVYLKDIASIEDSHEDLRVNTRFNGKPCVKLNILKQAEANTVVVAQAVKNRLVQLKKDITEDIEFGYVENQGDYVMGAIKSVRDAALLAAILVILVVYLFLGRWRQVVVMIVALPITLLANFFVMKIAGFSINLFSLGGLVVALSVILDNSIVVVENITRLKSEGVKDYARRGTEEVGSAIMTASLTFLAIFMPFLMVPGLASLLFKELVMVVGIVVVISLLIAVTLTPLLTHRLLQKEKKEKMSRMARLFEAVIHAITTMYSRILEKSLRLKWLVIVLSIAIFSGGLWLAGRIGSEFLPKVDDGRVMAQVKMPSGTSVEKVDRILNNIEKKIRDLPEIESIFSLAGGKVWGLYTYEIANEGELDIQLVPKANRKISTQDFIKKIKPMVAKVPAPGGKTSVMQMKVKGIRKIGEQEIEVKVKGNEITPIFKFAKEVADTLKNTSGLSNVNISMDMNKPEYRIYIDRVRASAMGISVSQVSAGMRALVNGIVSTQYREGSEYYDIRVMVPESKIGNKTDLENLTLENKAGKPVYLREIAEVRRAVGPVEIVREDQAKEVIVRADAEGTSVGEGVRRAAKAVNELERPPEIEFEMGGQAQMMAENRRAMGMILGFASLFAYVVLAIQFESFVLPLLIMVGIPLSLAGSFIALYVTGIPIGVTVLIGMVIMMGVIASQGVVLLALAEEYRRQGKPPLEAIRTAAPIRVRPIMMTMIAAVLGLVPLALNLGEGGDMLKPMAVAVIGGLLYSLLLTLIFLPAAYVLVARRLRSN